jgi:hypothetical protein
MTVSNTTGGEGLFEFFSSEEVICAKYEEKAIFIVTISKIGRSAIAASMGLQ